jgi:hypothetical protein
VIYCDLHEIYHSVQSVVIEIFPSKKLSWTNHLAVLFQVAWLLVNQGAQFGFSVCRVKNKFSFSDSELLGGYRDLTLSVVFNGCRGLRIIGEVQVC